MTPAVTEMTREVLAWLRARNVSSVNGKVVAAGVADDAHRQ